MTCPTTRRYPRSAVEAFPRTTEYACAVTAHRSARRWLERIGGVLMAIGIGVCLTLILWSEL